MSIPPRRSGAPRSGHDVLNGPSPPPGSLSRAGPPGAFCGEVDPVRHRECGTTKSRADSIQVETALEPRPRRRSFMGSTGNGTVRETFVLLWRGKDHEEPVAEFVVERRQQLGGRNPRLLDSANDARPEIPDGRDAETDAFQRPRRLRVEAEDQLPHAEDRSLALFPLWLNQLSNSLCGTFSGVPDRQPSESSHPESYRASGHAISLGRPSLFLGPFLTSVRRPRMRCKGHLPGFALLGVDVGAAVRPRGTRAPAMRGARVAEPGSRADAGGREF